jgi:hypothetical protein
MGGILPSMDGKSPFRDNKRDVTWIEGAQPHPS